MNRFQTSKRIVAVLAIAKLALRGRQVMLSAFPVRPIILFVR